MNTWRIQPRDALIVRDGRPNDRRSASASLPFPFPGTMAGVARTRVGSDPDLGFVLRGDDVAALLGIGIRGPLLCQGGALFFPAPLDAVVSTNEAGSWEVWRARPVDPAGAEFDDGLPRGMVPVGFDGAGPQGKAPRDLPGFWSWSLLESWLKGAPLSASDLLAGAIRGPLPEPRTHVAIDSCRGTGVEGALFGTAGLRFADDDWHDLSLWLEIDSHAMPERDAFAGIGPLGGERRLGEWLADAPAAPSAPRFVVDATRGGTPSVTLRVVLGTPAVFRSGSLPGPDGPLLRPRPGLSARLVAAAVGRPRTVSGWDFAKRAPKPTRRVAPAGSVYWVELRGSPEAHAAWLEEVWMRNVSDTAQDCRDGYGLALVGVA